MDDLPMDSTSRFRFRDQGLGESTESDSSTDISSESSSDDDEFMLKSMTGKGIKHLCSELLELKKASDDDFWRNVYSNHSVFIRVCKEVGGLETELIELKQHASAQRKLIRDLMDGIDMEVLSEESIESICTEASDHGQCPPSKLETYGNALIEILDILLSEQRLDEALLILERESMTLQKIQSEVVLPPQIITFYNSAITETRRRLVDQFALVAEHPRVSSAEFQKALSGLCRLNDNQRANFLLLRFYRSHLAHGVHDLQCSKPLLHGTYIWELAKFVFSMVSQAARSFVMLYGEMSPYTSELIQWAREVTEVFVCYFDKCVKSISETSGGLFLAVESVQHVISFCSLLEAQRIVLRPYLVKLIRPCMEEVLQMHVDHLKKVIGIFVATDSWVLGKFLVSGLLRHRPSPTGDGDKMKYCLLTSSGRKFVTLMQAIMEEVSPLVMIQLENSVLKGFVDLFTEYIGILKRSILVKGGRTEVGGTVVNSAKRLSQQLSLLANSSTLVTHFFSSIAESIFEGIRCSNDELLTQCTEHSHQRQLDMWICLIREAADQLRGCFCQQFVFGVMEVGEDSLKLRPEVYSDGQHEFDSLQDSIPSAPFQVLYLRLRELQRLANDVFAGMDEMVVELLRDTMEAVFNWISTNQEFWAVIEDSSIIQQSSGFDQFVLDVQFLVEIARLGGYISDDLTDASSALIAHMQMAFFAAELDMESVVIDLRWAAEAAKGALYKLQEIEQMESPLGEDYTDITEKDSSNDAVEDSRSFLENSLDLGALNVVEEPEGGMIPFECVSQEVGYDYEVATSSFYTTDLESSQEPNPANVIDSQDAECCIDVLEDDSNKLTENGDVSFKKDATDLLDVHLHLIDDRVTDVARPVVDKAEDMPETQSSAAEVAEPVQEGDGSREHEGYATEYFEGREKVSSRRFVDSENQQLPVAKVADQQQEPDMELPSTEGYHFALVEGSGVHQVDVSESFKEDDTGRIFNDPVDLGALECFIHPGTTQFMSTDNINENP